VSAYLIVKWLHVLSSVLLVGTGFGTAFYLYFANRTQSVPAIAIVSRLVVRADTWFTLPAAIFQPISGIWLVHTAGWRLSSHWIATSITLYVLAGACWLPVIWIQIRLRDMAADAERDSTTLTDRYWQYARWWEWLGYPAFIAMLGVYLLMVVKPALG
jgi:uncharacterized membrane protein